MNRLFRNSLSEKSDWCLQTSTKSTEISKLYNFKQIIKLKNNPKMVIQRIWKTTNTNSTENIHVTSSSEDSNSSWQTLSNSTSSGNNNKSGNGSKSTISNPQMAENVLKALKQRYNGRSYVNQTNADAAAQSIEIMRLNVQEAFNKEIEGVVRKYIEIFFKPALKNLKENLGESSVSKDCLQKVSCSLLENSKLQYIPKPFILSKTSIKTEPDTYTGKRKDPPDDTQTTNSIPSTQESVKRFQTTVQLRTVGRTKQIFWNVSNLNSDTLFVLDFKANRVFGFPDNGKERLASKHPELIRYLPDNNDKDWLLQQKILSFINRNGRILLLVYDEVCKIAQTDEYRNRTTPIRPTDLEGFKVPEFILHKMKMFFTELSVRSQSFLMNSHGSLSTSLPSINAGQSGNVISSNSSGSGIETGKSKSSLSSSHQTLTALLSNTVESVADADGIEWKKENS